MRHAQDLDAYAYVRRILINADHARFRSRRVESNFTAIRQCVAVKLPIRRHELNCYPPLHQFYQIVRQFY